MKTFRILLVIALLTVAIGFSAQPAAAGAFTYFSSIQVQNLEGSLANITLIFYKQDGTFTTVPDTVPANGSKSYFPLPIGSGFNGSVIVSSDRQVASISNVVGGSWTALGAYVAANAGNNNVWLPLLMKGNSGYNTWFNVQNTHSSEDAVVTINYSDGTSNGFTIKPGASHTFDQSTESHTKAVFAATITSNYPIAATVIEESTKILFAYSGFGSAGVTNPIIPLVNANNSNYVTGISLQNTGGTDTVVTISYTPSIAGTACWETQTIPSGGMKNFALNAFAGAPLAGMTTNCVGGAKFVGTAKVTTNSNAQNLVGIVNQLKQPGINGEAYGIFNDSAATSKVVLPLIMDRNGGYYTSINMMNVGGSTTTVNCTFSNTAYTYNVTLNAGKGASTSQNNKIASGYVGSATCTGGAGSKIIAVVNELGSSPTNDQLLVYEGINVAGP